MFIPALRREVQLRAMLWSVKTGQPPGRLPEGRLSVPRSDEASPSFMATCGHLPAGPLFVRVDRLERLAAAARRLSRQGSFQATPDLAAFISAKPRDLAGVLAAHLAMPFRAKMANCPLRRGGGAGTASGAGAGTPPARIRRSQSCGGWSGPEMPELAGAGEQRVDKWLWCARFFKSRTLAAKACHDGRIRVAGQALTKAHHPVKVGDVLTFPLGPNIRVVRVMALAMRRGPPAEARTLYEDLAPLAKRSRHRWRLGTGAPRDAGRPADGDERPQRDRGDERS